MAGNKYILMQEYSKALPIFEDIVKNSNDINDYFKYAFLLVMTGESQQALKMLKAINCEGKAICKFVIDMVMLNKEKVKKQEDKAGMDVFGIILGEEG
jgi:tetratricopeptide (TPR) repeat protein